MTAFQQLQSSKYNPLPSTFQPSPNDVLCGRGKAFANRPGNMRFTAIVKGNLQRYAEAPKRVAKSMVVASVVNIIKENGTRFIRYHRKTCSYYELSVEQTYEKVGHCLRDWIKVSQQSNISPRETKSNKSPRESLHAHKAIKQSTIERRKIVLDYLPLQVFSSSNSSSSSSEDTTSAHSNIPTPECNKSLGLPYSSEEEQAIIGRIIGEVSESIVGSNDDDHDVTNMFHDPDGDDSILSKEFVEWVAQSTTDCEETNKPQDGTGSQSKNLAEPESVSPIAIHSAAGVADEDPHHPLPVGSETTLDQDDLCHLFDVLAKTNNAEQTISHGRTRGVNEE